MPHSLLMVVQLSDELGFKKKKKSNAINCSYQGTETGQNKTGME